MAITQEQLEDLARGILLPIVLVLDAWVFQYLVFVYWLRRREFRVKMLFVASFFAFITHIYSHETYETLWEYNDISETCLQLTFTIQITIIGRDVSKKVKLRSIVHFTHAAEVLILASWIDVLGTALEVAGVDLGTRMHGMENWVESLSLAFVLVFRFFYLSLSCGAGRVLAKRKLEFTLYLLVAVHELPFVLLEYLTGVNWEFVQAIAMRVLIVACIMINVIHKARRSGRSSMTVRSAMRSTGREDEMAEPGGNTPSLSTLATIPALVRKFKLSPAVAKAPSIKKIFVGPASSPKRQ